MFSSPLLFSIWWRIDFVFIYLDCTLCTTSQSILQMELLAIIHFIRFISFANGASTLTSALCLLCFSNICNLPLLEWQWAAMLSKDYVPGLTFCVANSQPELIKLTGIYKLVTGVIIDAAIIGMMLIEMVSSSHLHFIISLNAFMSHDGASLALASMSIQWTMSTSNGSNV